MANLTKLEFTALHINGSNYLSWVLDVEMHLDAMNLRNTIEEGNATTSQEKAKVMIFFRHHIHQDLMSENLTMKNHHTLWNKLKERYGHLKLVHLPQACYDWIHLRLQDF